MDNLTRFYLALSTDANKMMAFMHGDRLAQLKAANVENAEAVAALDQAQLRHLLAQKLSQQSEQWYDQATLDANAGNSDNKVSNIGLDAYAPNTDNKVSNIGLDAYAPNTDNKVSNIGLDAYAGNSDNKVSSIGL